MRFLVAALALVFAFGPTSARAQDTSGEVFPYEYEVRDLPNGLRVIVVPTDYPNIVSLQIPVATGSRNEVEPGKSGFAHFFEHMMFRGTENYSSEEYREILKNAGADQNAYTTDDYTNYHITFSKEDLEEVLQLEADRFQNLKYSVEDFKTEARAVLGEYNKNAADPIRKIIEVQRNAAFDEHTYKHTTMGFIEDIEDMPNQYDYSLQFFDRYYRPEKTTVIVAGDVEPQRVFQLVEKYWGDWERGSYQADIPQEASIDGPVYEHVDWEMETLPWVTVAFHGPAFSDTKADMAAMDLISRLAFSPSSPLYEKLVLDEQKVQELWAYFPDRKDPYLLTVAAQVKDPQDVWYVRDEIQRTFADLRAELVSAQRLEGIKSNLRYSFANSLDNSEAIAEALPAYIALTRDVETVNRVYDLYQQVTPETLRDMARAYFTDDRLVVVTLSEEALPSTPNPAGSVDQFAAQRTTTAPEIETVLMQNSSPVVNFRILFNTGAAHDPEGKEGLAELTARMIAQAGSQSRTYEEIQQALFPMAAELGAQIDKEMTVFVGRTHRDNLNDYYEIVSDQLLNPGWREGDFQRIKSQLINEIRVALRSNNDEELGKEVLYEEMYEGHPYGHLTLGHVEALEGITLEDVQTFYREHYTQGNVVLGLAGDVSDAFVNRVKQDFAALPEGDVAKLNLPAPEDIDGLNVTLVDKSTRATAISLGFPIEVNRASEDFAALWLVRSFFGEHRSSNSYLYQRIREARGMNYGDYAYIEYFPRGMFLTQPDPNLARQQQIFQIWIRPVRPEQAHFALRAAMYELDKLIEEGLTQEEFEATRNFLLKYTNALTKSQDRQLGYALDSRYYGIPNFNEYITQELQSLTLDDVNRVIREHLQDENLHIVMITPNAEELRDKLVANTPSPITYDAPKPQELLEEDEIIQAYPLAIQPEEVEIIPVDQVFEDGLPS